MYDCVREAHQHHPHYKALNMSEPLVISHVVVGGESIRVGPAGI